VVGADGETVIVEVVVVLHAGGGGAVLGRAVASHTDGAAGLAEIGDLGGHELAVGTCGVADGIADPFVVDRGGVVATDGAGGEAMTETCATSHCARVAGESGGVGP
jgi:hypothetical protein